MVALGERTVPNGQELLAEFIQYGHQKPFEEIVRRYAGMVFNVCFRITKDKHEAEDAVQAVFLTLALQAKRGAEIKALGPWLQQVAKRLSLDIRRSKKRRKTREERHHAEQTVRRDSLLGDALPSADMDELKTVLHEELQKLPAKYRLPLILHYFGGLSRDEMAAELNCKASTLGVRIFRGREMLAGRLSGRGIHISGVALAALLGYAIKRAVSDTLIASTSHAATAMMAGHDGANYASAHVIGLTRRATNAVAFTKLKVAAMTLLLAGTSLGAGAKAIQMLPAIDVQHILGNQLKKLMQPLMQPFSRPMLSQANTSTPTIADNQTPSLTASNYAPPTYVATGSRPTPNAVVVQVIHPPVTVDPAPVVVATGSTTPKPMFSVSTPPPAVAATAAPSSKDNADPSTAAVTADAAAGSSSSGAAAGGGGFGGAVGSGDASSPIKSTSYSTPSRYADLAISSNNLIVGSPTNSSASNKTAPTAMVQIPTLNGTVTETNTGLLRGWGTIQKSGILQINGQVVADGSGIDRTLDLRTFSAVETASNLPPATASASIAMPSVISPSTGSSTSVSGASRVTTTSFASSLTMAAVGASDGTTLTDTTTAPLLTPGAILPPSNGIYAVNHGRVCLSLQPSSTDSSVLTWGENPNAPVLKLTNSVRIALTSDGTSLDDPTLTQLALLAPDRTDAPKLSEITGTTIGLWKVGDTGGEISNANLTISYDSLLANALGATQDSVQLWTLNVPSDSWELVTPDSFALDTADHLVYGSAEDFSYFAVSAIPSPDANVEFIRAHQLAVINGAPGIAAGSSSPSSSVPEPTGLGLLAAASAGLLGRRRRRVVLQSN